MSTLVSVVPVVLFSSAAVFPRFFVLFSFSFLLVFSLIIYGRPLPAVLF